MAWILLIIAGLFEVVWATALQNSQGLTRLVPTAVFLVAMTVSMILLARAMQTIPLGTAYPVWVGIGAVGAALVGLFVYNEPAGITRIVFLTMLVVSIIGLNMTSQ